MYYTAAYHQALGNQNLVIPWYDPQKLASAGDCAQFAAQLNEIAGRLSPEGLHLGYHNHQAEFTPVEGTTAWEILLHQTDGKVCLQYDVGNAARSGQTDVYATLQATLGPVPDDTLQAVFPGHGLYSRAGARQCRLETCRPAGQTGTKSA